MDITTIMIVIIVSFITGVSYLMHRKAVAQAYNEGYHRGIRVGKTLTDNVRMMDERGRGR